MKSYTLLLETVKGEPHKFKNISHLTVNYQCHVFNVLTR